MIQRVLRFLFSIFSAYSFYTNPMQFIVTTIGVSLVPILLYAVGGIVAFIFLLIIVGYFIYRAIKKNSKSESAA